MKQIILLTLLIVFPALPAMAYDYEENGFSYTFINSIRTATLVSVNSDTIEKNGGIVNIPEFINTNGRTYSVTVIGSEAFKNCTSLTSITIPESVTTIKHGAFSGCSGLTSITLPESITTIEYETFSGCSSLTSITIPVSVTTIRSEAFAGCSGLTSITLPESITTIEYETFSGCSSLTSITLPVSVTTIGQRAFAGCSGLTSITIPDSIVVIKNAAFYNCSGLTSITFPKTKTYFQIESAAFAGCINIISIYSYALKPPVIYDPYNYDPYVFDSDVVKTKATLYVLPEALTAYQQALYWREFWIEVMDESMTSIKDVNINQTNYAPAYDIQGRHIIGNPQSGQIYIQNGRKVLAK
ncbi:MAG: leucine-rich repeat domain-containing protein [Bacteroidaceae bacterium]|nr:leucine-rich repeat domain-containing protein [Bacteroidaceae bacterium]